MNTTIKSIVATAFALTFASNLQAQVTSIAPETFAQYGKDEAYFVADVNCEQSDSARAIQRKTDGNDWCGKDVAGYCGASKDEAAKKVCSDTYSSAIAQVEDAARKATAEKEAAAEQARAEQQKRREAIAEKERQEQARRAEQQRARAAEAEQQRRAAAAPLKKKITIEEQLITIEQEKLNLRRQELELQRRSVEIQKQLDNKS